MSVNQQIMNHLKVILGNDVESNIVSYISTMKQEEDYEEFMENIINRQNTTHINAYNAIKFLLFANKLKPKKKLQATEPKTSIANQAASVSESKNQSSYSKKGKKKFKDIREFQEEKTEKKGRHPCDCMGQEHEFMNNCLQCGRIHCVKEGPGPCLFCAKYISFRGEVQSASNAKPLMKPKLNKVFDDDNDYFKLNSKKSVSDKGKMVVALDFASRKVIESSQSDVKIRQQLLEDSIKHLKRVEEDLKRIQKQSQRPSLEKNLVHDELVDLLIQMGRKKPAEKEDLGVEDSQMPIIKYESNILDEDMISNIDQGLCLSLHQPYASLLVAGVKRHEGRVWPTTHRGRLWIAAAAKQPEEEEIVALENFYREFHKEPTLKFPKEYPTSCLLGCVTVEDCLDQEAYRKRFGDNEESSSPYVMICSNPIILPIFYPISGKHKIYPLDKEVHKCAKIALQHARYV